MGEQRTTNAAQANDETTLQEQEDQRITSLSHQASYPPAYPPKPTGLPVGFVFVAVTPTPYGVGLASEGLDKTLAC